MCQRFAGQLSIANRISRLAPINPEFLPAPPETPRERLYYTVCGRVYTESQVPAIKKALRAIRKARADEGDDGPNNCGCYFRKHDMYENAEFPIAEIRWPTRICPDHGIELDAFREDNGILVCSMCSGDVPHRLREGLNDWFWHDKFLICDKRREELEVTLDIFKKILGTLSGTPFCRGSDFEAYYEIGMECMTSIEEELLVYKPLPDDISAASKLIRHNLPHDRLCFNICELYLLYYIVKGEELAIEKSPLVDFDFTNDLVEINLIIRGISKLKDEIDFGEWMQYQINLMAAAQSTNGPLATISHLIREEMIKNDL
ncbi:unnamed protein product [Sphagnum jensenii]|uniref:Uncharacterized protein n=1 Tax=Sphagnum jensenii TaxID=128206 RepID=A0ABP0VA14_9BRYO